MRKYCIQEIVRAFVSLLEIRVVEQLYFTLNYDVGNFAGICQYYPAPISTQLYLENLLFALIAEASKSGTDIELIFSEDSNMPLSSSSYDLSNELYAIFKRLPQLAINQEYTFNGTTELVFQNNRIFNGKLTSNILISQNILNLL